MSKEPIVKLWVVYEVSEPWYNNNLFVIEVENTSNSSYNIVRFTDEGFMKRTDMYLNFNDCIIINEFEYTESSVNYTETKLVKIKSRVPIYNFTYESFNKEIITTDFKYESIEDFYNSRVDIDKNKITRLDWTKEYREI